MLRPVAVFLVGFSLVTPVFAQPASVEGRREPVLTVLGKGRYEARPDLARFSVTVLTEGRTLEETAKAHEPRATRALTALQDLKSKGIVIEKSSFKLDERRVQRPVTPAAAAQGVKPETVVAGYSARTTFSAKATSLSELNQIITAIAETGLLEIDALRFQVLEERSALNQARRAAMLDAQEQAKAYSEPVDLELGHIIAITDGEAEPITGYADLPARRLTGAYSVQIVPPSTVEFTASVNVTWRIAPRRSGSN